MNLKSAYPVVLLFCILIAAVAGTSLYSVQIWNEKAETVSPPQQLVIQDSMTVMAFGKQNAIPNPVLKKIFNLQSRDELRKRLTDFGMGLEEIQRRTTKVMALESEHESKNWVKIPLKFVLWFAFLLTTFLLLRRGKISARPRKTLYLSAVALFGIILGADPSPMGTVKDAIHLYATKQVIFPPRIIALSIFLLTVFLANKFICGWGCQVGALQDLIFRLNRNRNDSGWILAQYKPSFKLTNTTRIGFFVLFTLVAFLWATDIIGFIDPFKIYKPASISQFGWLFLGIILVASLFVYRPWCQFFCPFGLVAWLVEKASIWKIKVDYETCISCEACAKVCPSTVMGAILKRDRTIPDCFACGTCMEVCPTGSIRFEAGKRQMPPADKLIKGKAKSGL